MSSVLQYRSSDGLIVGMWTSNTTALVEAQIPQVDTTYSYLTSETDVSQELLFTHYYVHEGLLVAKAVLTLGAAPNPFTADGAAVCVVTVAPFVPCTVLVDGTPYGVTAEDTSVELTSDVPHVFHVELAPVAAYRADPLTVEAT